MEIYDRTSFWIKGTEDEDEFDRICQSLGLSGPKDFAIPAATWEAMKVRSSFDILPRLKLGDLEEEREGWEPEWNDVVGWVGSNIEGWVCGGVEGWVGDGIDSEVKKQRKKKWRNEKKKKKKKKGGGYGAYVWW